MHDQLKLEVKELKDLQMRLSKYSTSDDLDLDPNIKALFQGDPPDWVTNSTIFSPVVALLQSEINEMANIIREKQEDLRHLLREAKRTPKQPPRDYEAEIDRLQDNIKALNQYIADFSSSEYSYAYDSGTQLSALDAEIMHLRQAEDDLNNEISLLENDLRDCVDELTKAQSTSEIYKEELEKSRKMMKQYRMTLQMLEQTAQELNKNRRQLYERGQALANVITKLQLNKNENEKKIRKLEEDVADHQQLVASYRLLEDQIREQEKQQEIQLGKMVEAVELAEEAAAEAQKSRMARDGLTDELQRVKNLTSSTVKQFEEAFGQHEASMKAHFEGILNSIKERSAILEAENSQLRHDKESVQRQLETATQENAILKTSRTDSGFSEFVETMAQLKAEIEASYTKKEQLVAYNEKTQMNINDLKGKLVIHGSTAKTEQVELSQRAQKLEMELEMHKATCKDIHAKNAKLVADNQKIKNDIAQLQRAATSEIQNRLKDKDREVDEVKMQIESAQKANAKAIAEMQQAVLAFRQHADKWKVKAQSIGIEANDARQTAEGEQQQMIDHINDLDMELQKRKQLKEKCEQMLQQMNDQVKTMKQNITMAEKKHRQQQDTITRLLNQQNAFTTENGRNHTLLDSLTLKIRRQQRALNALSKHPAQKLVDSDCDSF